MPVKIVTEMPFPQCAFLKLKFNCFGSRSQTSALEDRDLDDTRILMELFLSRLVCFQLIGPKRWIFFTAGHSNSFFPVERLQGEKVTDSLRMRVLSERDRHASTHDEHDNQHQEG